MSRNANRQFRKRRTGADRTRGHQDWIELIDTDGPWLSLPVLTATWPELDAVTPEQRQQLKHAHNDWSIAQDDPAALTTWLRAILADFLGWGDKGLHFASRPGEPVDGIAPIHIGQHDTTVEPSFTLHDGEHVRLIGLVTPRGTHPAKRMPGETWAAAPIDRLVRLCNANQVDLGMATDGRHLALVYAPADGASAYGVFDTETITEGGDRDVLRALYSLLNLRRFTDYEPAQQLPALFKESAEKEEDLTETLGVQVRRAVELLVEAIGRAHLAKKRRDGTGITVTAEDGTTRLVEADEVYRGAVTVMMRLVFLLFAEERRLLPADNPLYAESYSIAEAAEQLRETADSGSEAHLEQSHRHWLRLLALFNAVHRGVDTPELAIPAYGGSLFDPATHPWLTDMAEPLAIDDRTVHNVLKSVTTVWMSAGRQRSPKSLNGLQLASGKRPRGEWRKLNFDRLGVEQIGYVYEGLLAWEGRWADDIVVGLIGSQSKEAEVYLTDLEDMRRAVSGDVDALAAELYERFEKQRKTGIGSASAIAKLLAPMDTEQTERAMRDLRAVTGNDGSLAERLLPFYGIIRADLRGQATVVLKDMLYMTESELRGNTGAHYTPRKLADEVVKGALEPLVYEPGPLQTADESEWKLKSSKDILGLKVADIAMGSAAFLVAACRFLSARLLEAWKIEDDPRAAVLEGDESEGAGEDPNLVEARRLIIEHCLYGADINPAAVEMAKLSLWLVSMDKDRPFTFLDDRLVCGDSLLGITNVEQLEYMHLDPVEGRRLHEGTILDYTAHVRDIVAEAAEARKAIAEIGDKSATDQEMKRELLERAQELTAEVYRYADLLVGAGLAGSVKSGGSKDPNRREAMADEDERRKENLWLIAADLGSNQTDEAREYLDRQAAQWLRTDKPIGAFERDPIHWALVFPEVFEVGGFNAVIGNPPFLGGQRLRGSLGYSYREYVVEFIGRGARGSADLVAYFLLRAEDLLSTSGQTGLIATNTLAQGDTREVGLDQVVAEGGAIRSAIKSEPWPSKSAVLEYCVVWTSKFELGENSQRYFDRAVVEQAISSSLDLESRATGRLERLEANSDIAFQGSNILGLGFTMDPDSAKSIINEERKYAEVLFPYLNGQDLNQSPSITSSRWVINFRDWTEARAKDYPRCYEQVVRLVKPERSGNANRQRREFWWRFTRPTLELYDAISGMERTIVLARVSKTALPLMVETGQVFNEKIVVFASNDFGLLALLSSSPHYWWSIKYSSTRTGDLNYSPTDVFHTLPRPELSSVLRALGERLDSERRELMLARQAGLTDTYNMVHDRAKSDADILNLREIHRLIDIEVCRCYGWDDLIPELAHDHYETRQGDRYTIAPGPRQEILDRLLEENQRRYAEEVKQGLHLKGSAAKKAAKKASKPKPQTEGQDSLF
ncbi:Eco57I restriction-modification methylase domain-containing protein [Glycomyces algeriensis]|uniref:site-specific DNA-methyltransferase (adenine-specific) n=1 Tax=Glycomyces algeriensis TaxID=256037 RepID=A0A9W6GCW9_9ACTN|nr:DNA methyltransferase [Glycomyces algeriensis]MDA1368343.1 hypothetical protein [Glycomyces algeriensis]MDR7351784.1 hypothetical protein [Glycomyces algeriensis]GLI44512.1 hypothetical protein GALLR39Z86_43620 [Glycomyces algeriensis]